MTPTQLDHLKLIDAHLERLIGIASKRTPGEWELTYEGGNGGASFPRIIDPGDCAASAAEVSIEDAFFIAACAGNAEAGWRATRVAINDWLCLYNATEGYADGAPDASTHDKLCNEIASICRISLQHILAAFPLETLK
jgi:hypothetical protein